MARAGRPPRDPAHQLARAHRILDAVAELVLRWGYDKTTIDDLAKRAGVAKGTIYLHWKTRDEIFAALLRRERVHMMAELRDRAPATPGELFGEYARGLLRRPLLQAALTGDSEVLGKLTRQKRSGTSWPQSEAAFAPYLARLVRLGAIRDDPGDHIVTIGSIVYGFLFMRTALPDHAVPSDDRVAELVADTVERALSAGRPLSPADAEAVARATLDFLDAAAEVAQRKLDASLGSKERVQ
ncbi:TetR/AcrR family transcriptional regulator [Nonomuraea gerenzanensis]|uniref:Transcriptional regulator, TetR family n=1 Tax=Nonomuraea gerenzanensis TaxID=93944 RepID=A0A1M4E4E2_9ACTN|nr:TetR/AcrR family transcriptional regulator [Nonomuraea gerenzanensis]UBU15863.1 TetR/AcrR family transcriptional regulator [Nonomuraea gerenzanensis]SBO93654.1 Transcriptional regulator, TetR family [Nonomuraea gerenzanensis]